MSDKNKAVIDYLLQCPQIQQTPLYFNFINAKDNTNQIVTSANDRYMDKPYVTGAVVKLYTFTIVVFKSITDDAIVKIDGFAHENVEELAYIQELINWITEQNELRNKLAGQGVAFNADGTIGNYTQAFAAQQAQLNNIINYYNSLSSDGQKGYQATLDAAQERFKDFQKDMDRYDTLVSDFIPNLQENIQSAIDKQIDIQIQEFDMAIELRLDLTKATKDWNEFKKKIIDDIKEDDILGNAQAKLLDFSMYYDENGKGVIQSLSKQLNDTLAELAVIDSGQTSKVYGDDKNKALEDLKKY